MTFDRAAFGRAVLARRRALKLPQTAVPNGPSSSYMSDIENGKMDPISADTLDKLAAGLTWDRSLLEAVSRGDSPIDVLPTSAPDENVVSSAVGTEQLLREANDAQVAFERAVDDMLTAEAALDRANQRAFREILIDERLAEAQDPSAVEKTVTAAQLAKAIADFGILDSHEWTRYEIALIERFDRQYTDRAGDLTAYSKFLDMTAARRRVSRIARPDDEDGEGGLRVVPNPPSPGGSGNLSEADDTVSPAALDAVEGVDEEPGGSAPDES